MDDNDDGSVKVWMFVPHPWSLQVEIVTVKVMVIGGGASGRGLGHEGRAFRNRISVLISLE